MRIKTCKRFFIEALSRLSLFSIKGLISISISPLTIFFFTSDNKNTFIDEWFLSNCKTEIIGEELKLFYYCGLKECKNERLFAQYMLTAQDKFKLYLEYFNIQY